MITLPRTVRVWAYGRPVDLRKGYNGLVGIVENELRSDPMGGELYLFVNVKRTGCKVLLWDGTELCIFMKRLERGGSSPTSTTFRVADQRGSPTKFLCRFTRMTMVASTGWSARPSGLSVAADSAVPTA